MTIPPIPVEIIGQHQDIAAWIIVGAAVAQAVGSVAAIIIAIWLGERARRLAHVAPIMEQRSRWLVALEGVLQHLDEVLDEVAFAAGEAREEGASGHLGIVEDRLRSAVRVLGILEKDDELAIETMAALEGSAAELTSLADGIAKVEDATPAVIEVFASAIRWQMGAILGITDELSRRSVQMAETRYWDERRRLPVLTRMMSAAAEA
jgi:hypothetical protein